MIDQVTTGTMVPTNRSTTGVLRAFTFVGVLLAALAGCGGDDGKTDAGRDARADARRDTGNTEQDSGNTEQDSGNTEQDSGNTEQDSGATDSGNTDSGNTDGGTLPTLSIADATAVTEGNSGTTNASFTVTLSAASTQTVTVAFASANGTATTAGNDYAASSGTLTFAPGETTQTVTVAVNGDAIDEADETFTVTLSSPTGATLTDATATGTITDDDAAPTLSIDDVTVVEGNTGTTNATFTVSLSAASGQSVTAMYATANGTATAGSDYTAATGTVTFAPGETSKTIVVTITGDTTVEASETFTVALSAPTNATLADGTGAGTISDDDTPAQPRLTVNDVTVAEGNAGTTNATFTVTLSAASTQAVTLSYATSDGTATTAGGDYTATSGTLSFAPGETSKTIAVAVAGDALNEANETFTVDLSGASNAVITDAQGVGTITNDDAVPTLAINNTRVLEGNAGTTVATFLVTLSAPSGRPVTVAYATANGTAVSNGNASAGGADYVSTSGTLTFAPGVTTQPISVIVNGDTLDEGTGETFTVALTSPVNATLVTATGTATIVDDDDAPTITVSRPLVRFPEGNSGTSPMAFTVALSSASGQTITVAYATANGTALAGSDYVATSGTLTFAPGETTKTVSVSINGDIVVEPSESLLVNLSAPTNATILDGSATGVINNDDGTGASVDSPSTSEGNVGTKTLVFTITLSAPSTGTVTVSYATANVRGGAVAGTDYVAATGMVTFSPGQTSKTVAVTINGDTVFEADEAFVLNLTSATGASIIDPQGTGTITNDDTAPTLSVANAAGAEGNTGTTTITHVVTLSAASGRTTTVNFATADGTAVVGGTTPTGGADYASASGTLIFAPGETTKNIVVTINGDTIDEPNETYGLTLSTPTNATILDGQATGTITDDDLAPSLSINNVSGLEGTGRNRIFTLTVTLSAASAKTVTVGYSTANGTASGGTDYTAASGVLTFAPGETTKTISVTVVGDATFEPNETFSVNLASATNASIADPVGTVTIQNDDTIVIP